MDDCYPLVDSKTTDEDCKMLTFNYRFNTLGYLPYFIPVVANFGRIHSDSNGHIRRVDGRMKMQEEKYYRAIEDYKKQLINERKVHRYRDGFGNLLSGGFNQEKYESKTSPPGIKQASPKRKVKTILKRILE